MSRERDKETEKVRESVEKKGKAGAQRGAQPASSIVLHEPINHTPGVVYSWSISVGRPRLNPLQFTLVLFFMHIHTIDTNPLELKFEGNLGL